MPYIIYRHPVDAEGLSMGPRLYRSMTHSEDWSPNINESAIFRSRKNGNERIRDMRHKWAHYSTTWVGHENHPFAIKQAADWEQAQVGYVDFVLTTDPAL